jgi:hypothetical protein
VDSSEVEMEGGFISNDNDYRLSHVLKLTRKCDTASSYDTYLAVRSRDFRLFGIHLRDVVKVPIPSLTDMDP